MSIEDSRQFKFGQAGESAIAKWMRARGWYVLPIYEKQIDDGKGPRLFTPTSTLVGTDMFAFKGAEARWIEAKHKSAFSYSRRHSRLEERDVWNTGIDLHHYADYCKIDDETPWPVWLMFLHRDGRAKDTPPDKTSPTGLFGHQLRYLREHEHHRDPRGSKKGMVYWTDTALIPLASLEEVYAATRLSALKSRGVELCVDGDKINISGSYTPDDITIVRANKPLLMTLLKA